MPGFDTWSLRHAPGDDFAFDERGHLVLDHTVATSMKCALTHALGTWWANPDHGSRIAEIMRGTPERDQAAALDAAVRQALDTLQRARRIRDLRVDVTVAGNRARVTVHALDVARTAPVTLEIVTP